MPEPVLVVIAPLRIVSTLPTSTAIASRNGPRRLAWVGANGTAVDVMGRGAPQNALAGDDFQHPVPARAGNPALGAARTAQRISFVVCFDLSPSNASHIGRS